MNKQILIALAFVTGILHANAQEYNGLWQPSANPLVSQGTQIIRPETYAGFRASEQNLSIFLSKITEDVNLAMTIELPTPDGNFRTFKIWQTPAMAKELSAKYPGIRTFTAEATDNKSVTAKIDYTPFGFHAMVFDGRHSFFVDPYTDIADGNYISYYRDDYYRPSGKYMNCETKASTMRIPGMEASSLTTSDHPKYSERQNGSTKRKYRIGIGCTGEYAVAVAGATPTKAAVLAKIVTSVNRVNGVFEREFSYTMELIGAEDTLINLDGATDPYTNNNGAVMVDENQAALATRVGLGAFDIGHVFSTGGGGMAQLGSVCVDSTKAKGVTGSINPVGDAFDIDYVAHEIGHQFGAEHTFNNNTSGACTNNAVSAQAYEPGSGSTIMAYAGICVGGNDYQRNSDAYFHSASLEQIAIYIGTTSCAITTTAPNQNASVATFNATYSIPYLTPFELTVPGAQDNTADEPITYAWEERDLGDFGKSLSTTRLTGPLFRPFTPVGSTTRIFPQIDSVLKGRFSYNAEKLPDTGRKLVFRLVERDFYQGFGCWNFPTDSIRLEVIYTGQPFKVTSPVAGAIWAANGNGTIAWNTGGTTASPISCQTVDIFMSVDGGYTWPYTLATGTANDGTETVNIPNVNTSKMRIKVKGHDNVFFSVSPANATVSGGVGVESILKYPIVVISPIPATDVVSVEIKDENAYAAKVTDAVGQLIWSGALSGHRKIDVGSWTKGIYYMHIKCSTVNTPLVKLIIIR